MGVGGNFWDLLRPYARNEGFDFLRDKRVAVDLSFWIVQHETAIKTNARKPHLRLTFFRTINLFSKVHIFSLPITLFVARKGSDRKLQNLGRLFEMSFLKNPFDLFERGKTIISYLNYMIIKLNFCTLWLSLSGWK